MVSAASHSVWTATALCSFIDALVHHKCDSVIHSAAFLKSGDTVSLMTQAGSAGHSRILTYAI